ncbi:MAG: hypothetical protein A2Y77_10405 [Planctomycetes bacterium RBG_13_62_9]|nr:MAG: hypothetical protein A2Y77_10405 [Planctomycetes bacterium RBG_13_62_9]
MVSNKCEYALRAIFELTLQAGDEPRKVQDIASAQEIPPRFLEIILVELRNGGLVVSKRGSNGGYALARDAQRITVGDVIRCVQGEQQVPLQSGLPGGRRTGDIAFASLWERAQAAISDVYDKTTFADLLQEEVAGGCVGMSDYVI